MASGKRTIRQLWADHRKATPVAVAWGLLTPLIYLAVAAEPLKVAGLPVT